MRKLRNSPFKVNTIEDDPKGFGLRTKEIIICAEALYNRRSVLLSGPRGIGKSSLGNQLQQILRGESALLERIGIDAQFPKTIGVFYACDSHDTLEQMILNILYRIEIETLKLPKVEELKASFEVNWGIIKASLEAAVQSGSYSPSTTAAQFVAGLETALTAFRSPGYKSINIMVDELDQLNSSINFGHFMKIVHESLNNAGLNHVTFIFAGQKGIYTRLIRENPSFERIVRHVPLSVLDEDASHYILEHASRVASPQFRILDHAKSLMISLSSGYPYTIHLLGDSAFWEMDESNVMTHKDVLNGIEFILQSDKREKYLVQFVELSRIEKSVVIVLSEYASENIPIEIPYSWLVKRLNHQIENVKTIDEAIESLTQKGHLIAKKGKTAYVFTEELFRVFISFIRMEQREIKLRGIDRARKEGLPKVHNQILIDILSGEFDLDDLSDLRDHERNNIIEELRTIFLSSNYVTNWDKYAEIEDALADR